MKKIDFYSKFAPEPGIEYYSESTAFIIWEGYFDELFRAIAKDIDYEQFPIEFKEYFDLSGWKDDDVSTIIKPEATIKAISLLDLEDLKVGKTFVDELIIFLKKRIDSIIKIREYW